MEIAMIERVARAMALVDKMDEGRWEYLIPHARAAIEAMREPTEAMVDAAYSKFHWGPPMHENDAEAERVWGSMIDAALEKAP